MYELLSELRKILDWLDLNQAADFPEVIDLRQKYIGRCLEITNELLTLEGDVDTVTVN